MNSLETVIFDLGNVLLPLDWGIARKRMCDRTGCSRRELETFIVNTPFLEQLELGQLTAKQFFEIIARELRFTGTQAEFEQIWSDIFTIDDAMIDLTQKLKGSYRRFILSNTSPQHIEFVFARYPVLRDFDGHILSYEVGLLKPDRRIYELALHRFGIAVERAVFIDDLPANIAGAREVGLAAIQHKSFKKTCRELTRLGIPNI